MKRLLIGALLLVCGVQASAQEEFVPPLRLSKYNLQSLSSESLSSRHVIVLRTFHEKDLKVLGSFPSVRVLDFYQAQDIADVRGMPIMDSVLRLNLRTRPISDLYLEHLVKACKNLQELDLSCSGVLGNKLYLLKGLQNLTILNLSSTLISKKEYIVDLLEGLPKLIVYLHDTLIDEGTLAGNPRVIFKPHNFE